jgi:hypothetical protein
MHIRQLARNAALITVAAIVTAGFSTGIAQATNAAPASTVSAVTPGGSTTPRMLPGCDAPQFCTYASSIRGLVLLQHFGCTGDDVHYANYGSEIFEMVNLCHQRVYYYYHSGTHGCMNPNSNRARSGNFARIDYFYVDFVGQTRC